MLVLHRQQKNNDKNINNDDDDDDDTFIDFNKIFTALQRRKFVNSLLSIFRLKDSVTVEEFNQILKERNQYYSHYHQEPNNNNNNGNSNDCCGFINTNDIYCKEIDEISKRIKLNLSEGLVSKIFMQVFIE